MTTIASLIDLATLGSAGAPPALRSPFEIDLLIHEVLQTPVIATDPFAVAGWLRGGERP